MCPFNPIKGKTVTSHSLRILHRIRTLVTAGRYTIGAHAERHMLEEGFEKEHCIGAILDGRVIEHYEARRTCLISGLFHVGPRTLCRLHVVCDYSQAQAIDIVTAFIPTPLR